jgi:type III restriction enzyme
MMIIAPKLQLKFDANQEHQLRAVESVARLFEGMPRYEESYRLSDEIMANLPSGESLADALLLPNLDAVQRDNHIPADSRKGEIERDKGNGLAGVEAADFPTPHFTVEMETGTGKTYVYLRTIYELRRRYGWSKFVIVVPSIAIYEGVIKNVEITRGHFRALYDNEPFDLIPYDGAQLSRIRHFATANTITVLLITLDAFNKPTNNLYKVSEKLPGERRPYQFIQETRPILILDEPQNMESARAKEALRTLNPLFALRYSATHRTHPNLVYQLTPVDAYQRALVKHIEVYGVTEKDNPNVDVLALAAITPPPKITARVRARVTDLLGTRETDLVLRQGDDLFLKTERPEHRAGYVVENIDAGAGFVEFRNGQRLYLDDVAGPSRPVIFREQVRQTILRHMEWQSALVNREIKVLSLFFIDRVANYASDEGLIRRLFEEEFERLKFDFGLFKRSEARDVHRGYFAYMRQKGGGDIVQDTSSRTTEEREAERKAFELIMRDKERLLSFDEPVSFIFAHSALKEGWDNPNVFQICTLNQTVSEIRKRQEIGRGLRLCVDQTGERVHDEDINILTVVANESYHDYATRLQQEYKEDGDIAPPLPGNAKLRQTAKREDKIFYHSEQFAQFWERLNRRARYRISVDTDTLVQDCIYRVNQASYPGHVLVVEKGRIQIREFKIKVVQVESGKAKVEFSLFDQNDEDMETSLTIHVGEDVAKRIKDDRLKSLGPLAIKQVGGEYRAVFTNAGLTLAAGKEHTYTPDALGGQARERFVQVRSERYPVFNLIDRAAQQTGLTRPTINAIFRQMNDSKKAFFLKNPEGFANVFIRELRNALAKHIADNIEFTIEEEASGYDLQELFPPTRTYPQKEVIDAGPHGLYDLIQKDSEVEQRYVEAIKHDGDAIKFYFKFPPKFKIDLPEVIGDYNPDWGIARVHRNGKVEVRAFVHETKGGELGSLRFPQEERKVRCAQQYFAAIGVNYRPIDPDRRGDWWEPTDGAAPLPGF